MPEAPSGGPRRKCRRCGEASKRSGCGEAALDDGHEFHPHHALNVPRGADLTKAAAGGGEPVTTLMLRHVPCRYTQPTLMRELDLLGFEGRYDFFYLPMDVRNKTSVGYAFINFVDVETAAEFAERMEGYRFQRHPSEKVPEASAAHLQGLKKNVAHFSSRSVLRAREAKYRPVVLQGGVKRDFAELLVELSPQPQPSLGLNPKAPDFVPGAGSKTSCLGLNPLAQEFVPVVPPGLPKPEPLPEPEPAPKLELAPALHSGPPKPEPAPAPKLELAPAPRPVPSPPLEPLVLLEARRSLEEAVAGLLRRTVPAPLELIGLEADGASCVDEAFDEVIGPQPLSWVAKAFVELIEIEDELEGGWVAQALEAVLVGGSSAKLRPRRHLSALLVEPSAPENWVAEALATSSSLAGCSTLAAKGRPGCSACSTPRNTPRHESVRRLKAMGGWAWKAFDE